VQQSATETTEVVNYRKRNPTVASLTTSRDRGLTYTWLFPKGITAEVRFTGGEVQPFTSGTLGEVSKLAKSAIETEDEKT